MCTELFVPSSVDFSTIHQKKEENKDRQDRQDRLNVKNTTYDAPVRPPPLSDILCIITAASEIPISEPPYCKNQIKD
jgi:hypothetical protein